MESKESFIVYTEWLQYFNMLPTDAERADIIRAMFEYNISGKEPDEKTKSPVFMLLFTIMKNQFDRDIEKYQKIVERNRENARRSRQQQANATERCQSQPLATTGNHSLPIAADNDNVNVNDNDNVNDVISNDITISASAQSEKKKRFVKPTVEEVMAYCQERGNTVDAETFVNFYESKGWMVGKNHMKDWKSAVRTWEQSRKGEPKPKETFSSFETDDFIQASLAHSRAKIQESLGG